MSDVETVYSSGQAAALAGISGGSLRNYCQGGRFGRFYAAYLSAGAAPAPASRASSPPQTLPCFVSFAHAPLGRAPCDRSAGARRRRPRNL